MPERVILRPFMPIKLKKAPAGLAPTFPSEIRTAQAAIKFVNSLDPKTRAKLHWKRAASALAALDTGAIRQGAYDRANKAMRISFSLLSLSLAARRGSRKRPDPPGGHSTVGPGLGTTAVCAKRVMPEEV